MRPTVSNLTQSQFYSPAFNAAIFDGPVRIYFAQYQESLALKVYFRIQERLKGFYESLPESMKYSSQHLFVMLYPNVETFGHSFPNKTSMVMASSQLGEDMVLGISAPLSDEDIESTAAFVEPLIRSWMSPAAPKERLRPAEL